jgi:hypothetical protein
MTFDTTGAFASWLSWDNPSGPVHVAELPAPPPPGLFSRLFARIREAF